MNATQTAYVVCGNAGAGKSTFATKLCAQQRAALLDIDTVTERLVKLALRGHGVHEDDRDSPAYKALLREPVYETLFDIAAESLRHVPCVIVGPFTRERREPDWPQRLSLRLGAEVVVYYVVCSTEQRRLRLEQRGNPRDRGKLINFAEYARQGDDPAALPFPHHRIDTTLPE